MTLKGQQNTNFANVATPGGETGEPVVSAAGIAPLCDEFGRLIVVIDGLVNTTGGGGGGGGLPAFGAYGQSLTVNSPTLTPPFAAEWQSTSLLFGGVDVPPFPNQWTVWTLGGSLGLPAFVAGFGAGVYAVEDVNVTCSGDASLVWNGVVYPGVSTSALIPAGTYAEWFSADISGDLLWVPRVNAAGGGSSFGGLNYAVGTSPNFGEWVLAANSVPVTLPFPTETGQRVGVFLSLDSNTTVESTATVYIDRRVSNSASLRPGGWYEWTSVYEGEGNFAWIPHGGSGHEAKSPLEYGGTPISNPPLPNQWLYAVPGDVAHTPENPQQGDCTGIYVNGASVNIVPANGQSIISPDGVTVVAFPSSLTLLGNNYYEWVWVEATSHWKVKTGVYPTDAKHGNRGGGALHADATTSVSGFLSGAEKVKLAGLSLGFKSPVRVASLVDVTQQSAGGTATIDSVVTSIGDRVLLTSQTDGTKNGIYIVSAAPWSRATDADTSAEVSASIIIPVAEGNFYQDSLWILITNDPIVLGTTSLNFQHLIGLRGSGSPPQVRADINGSAGSSLKWAPIDHSHGLVISYKEPVRVVSTSNVAAISGLLTIDSTTLVAGDRVLLTGQTTTAQNGIWTAAVGAWTRPPDADAVGDLVAGTIVTVAEGGTNGRTTWYLTTTGVITPGTTGIAFIVFGGAKSAAVPSAIIANSTSGSPGSSTQWAPIDHQHKFPAPDLTLNNFRISNNATSIPTDGSASTVTLAPHNGTRITLYNAPDWFAVDISGAAPTIAVTGQTAGVPCDVFAVYAGLTTATLVLLPWTNATTRATTLYQFNGVWTRSATQNQRYVGTILPDSATTFSQAANPAAGTKAVCGLWNQDNRILSPFTWTAAFDTASPAAANVWANIGTTAAPHIEAVIGQSIDAISAHGIAGCTTGGNEAYLGLGFDSSTVVSGLRSMCTGTGTISPMSAIACVRSVAVGRRTINLITQSTNTLVTWYGAHGSTNTSQAGVTAEIWQ